MYKKRNLGFTLVISAILLLSGCGNENSVTEKTPSTQINPNKVNKIENIAEIELELDTTLTKMINSDFIGNKNTNYQKASNLLSVKIINNVIKLYFDEISMTEDFVMEDFTDPLYSMAYNIAIKKKINNPKVEIYFDGRFIDDIMEEKDKEIENNFPELKRKENKLLFKTSSKKVIINSGHGRTRAGNGWGWQRDLFGGYREDIGNAEFGMILASKLKANGIIYESVRELNKNAGNGVSGLAKWKENARQYMIAHKYPKGIWQSKNDGYINNDIRSRPNFANYKQAGVLISLHTNGGHSSARGTQIYISDRNSQISESTKLAKILKKHLKSKITSKYDPNWSVEGPIQKNHGENRIANMPSVIIELGYHTNTQDRKALTSNVFRDATMEAVKDAIKEYLNIGDVLPTIRGEFDGAGSIVSPTEDNWGCNRDIAVMHPHQNTGSTVVFQWAYNKDTCTQLELFANNPIDVAIKSKAWSQVQPDQAFTVKLGSSPVTLKTTGSKWSTFAVTTLRSLPKATTITARCVEPSHKFYNANRKHIAKDLVSIVYPYYWTGTGSIISYASHINGYGKNKDIAVSSSKVNSVTSFQWATHSCKRLQLTSGGSNSSIHADIRMKGWDKPNNYFQKQCNNRLPCTLQVSGNGYYILQIATTKGAISSGQINADCI